MANQEIALVSYTLNFEDVLLCRCFRNVQSGFYVDIGAGHPTYASVTRWFYDHGWSGMNVEPGLEFDALRNERTRDINLEVAVADFEGEATFWVHAGNSGTSTLSETVPPAVSEKAGEIRPVIVRVTTLPSILDRYAPGRHIHFLKIDAEGAEDAIIRAADWERHRPEVVLIESTEPYTTTRRNEPWQARLAENGYQMAYFDGINDFWVRKESSHLLEAFAVPVNVLDCFRIFDPEIAALQAMAATQSLELASAKDRIAALEAENKELRAARFQASTSKARQNWLDKIWMTLRRS
jgi:FkbM family methyltransferase